MQLDVGPFSSLAPPGMAVVAQEPGVKGSSFACKKVNYSRASGMGEGVKGVTGGGSLGGSEHHLTRSTSVSKDLASSLTLLAVLCLGHSLSYDMVAW